MSLLLIHQAQMISTQNNAEQEIQNGSILIENGLIKEVFTQEAFERVKAHWLGTADQIIDAKNHVVIPGMVNCHHHMVQSLTRIVSLQLPCSVFTSRTAKALMERISGP